MVRKLYCIPAEAQRKPPRAARLAYNHRMRKRVPILLLIVLVLLACNLPFAGGRSDAAEVATRVAIAQKATQDQAATVLPTLASSPTQPELPILTPASSPSPEPSPTETAADFTSQLGAPTYSNAMNSGSAFGLDASGYDDGYTRIQMSDGAMVLSAYSPNGWRGWRLTDRGMSNFYMEGSFTTLDCAGKDQYGLVFRSPDYATGEGFYFGVTCDGRYSLLLYDGTQYQTLIALTSSDKINQGSNQTNRLGVLAEGSSISLFVNGVRIDGTTNSTYETATKVGVFIQALSTPGFTVNLDQLTMWAR